MVSRLFRLSSSIIIHHHPSSSIIIHHHPSSSIIIHHPSSSIIIHHLLFKGPFTGNIRVCVYVYIYIYIYRNQMSYLPISHHHTTPHPPTYLGWLAQGGGCFLPRLLAKIPQFLAHSGPSILYESERNFFYRFLPSKIRVLGFRRGKTLAARYRPWCLPFCARVSAFFYCFLSYKMRVWGVRRGKTAVSMVGPSKML